MSTRFPRSCYDLTGGVVYFARMLDKIRLHAKGELGPDYHANLGKGFDERTCQFLGVKYDDLKKQVLAGASDEAALKWCFAQSRTPSEDDIIEFNETIQKRGWRDSGTLRLRTRLKEAKLDQRTDILTFFDFIEADEHRPLPKFP
ncbi:MAG TPA: DUF5069 domain-containing protein [Opitutales bacterium]|nr:DUF5069 domain-containing protein [Opitutales bacterium]